MNTERRTDPEADRPTMPPPARETAEIATFEHLATRTPSGEWHARLAHVAQHVTGTVRS